jgi:hypothetical protein
MRIITPEIGCWYKELQEGSIFEVVAVDDFHDTIEVQMLDGELCEFDGDTWQELWLDTVEEPEDWRHPFELSDEDSRSPDDIFHPEDWNNPLANIEPDIINGVIDENF